MVENLAVNCTLFWPHTFPAVKMSFSYVSLSYFVQDGGSTVVTMYL